MIAWKRISPARIEKMNNCLIEYQTRKEHLSHPAGDFSFDGLWLPEKREWRNCCRSEQAPSRHLWFTLQHHCRSLKHLCVLFECDERFVRERWLRIQRGELGNPLEADVRDLGNYTRAKCKNRQSRESFQVRMASPARGLSLIWKQKMHRNAL